ncbi:MAG TPA: hypothetical protein VIF57_22215 [Polyangia bacterium]|jgi:hypothetical protein
MSVSRWFSMVLIVVALPSVAARALARGDRGGHPTRADEPQVRELLAKLAAASGTPEPEERTDADLMYEAMLRWNGEPAESKTIDRVLDQSKRDAAKAKRAMQDKVRHMFWKDPFADDGHKLVPVRQEDRDLLDSYARKQRREPREAREPRDEVSRLRAELAEARAENARIRDRADESPDRRGCVADASSSDERRKRRRIDGASVRSHHAEGRRAEIALASTVPEQPYTPPAPPPVTPAASPPAHGIIIEHLPSPSPPPPAPVVEARRRAQRSR